MKESLGLIETIGLTAGIEAADAAVKSANVKLVGYELTKGSGMTTVKLEGDVAAVKAAVEAGAMAASRVGRVVSTLVIPRPSSGLEGLIRNRDTVGYKKAEETVAKKETKKTVKESVAEVKEEPEKPSKEEKNTKIKPETKVETKPEKKVEEKVEIKPETKAEEKVETTAVPTEPKTTETKKPAKSPAKKKKSSTGKKK